MTDRNPETGFTLIEALVALSVISVGAIALIAASETTLQRVYGIEISRAASWVADAELAKIELGSSVAPAQSAEVYGIAFEIRPAVSPLPNSELEQITLEVYAPTAQFGGSNMLARQVGFRRSNITGP